MIPQVGGFQGCYLDNHRNNWRCARAVPTLCENAPLVPMNAAVFFLLLFAVKRRPRPRPRAAAPPRRYIFACECIYRDAPMPELVGALVELSDAQTDIYVCYKWRKNSPIALFFDLIAPHFEAHQVSAEELQMAAMDCGEPFDLHDLHLYILRRKAPALEHAVS